MEQKTKSQTIKQAINWWISPSSLKSDQFEFNPKQLLCLRNFIDFMNNGNRGAKGDDKPNDKCLKL